MTGRLLDEQLGKLHFWLTFIGFHVTFLVQHWLGNDGMPRRYADYLPTDGFTTLNTISTIGVVRARRLDAAVPLERRQVLAVRRGHHRATTRGATATRWSGRPPPRRRGTTSPSLPRIRSERPAFELHYPHMVERLRAEAHVGPGHKGASESLEESRHQVLTMGDEGDPGTDAKP